MSSKSNLFFADKRPLNTGSSRLFATINPTNPNPTVPRSRISSIFDERRTCFSSVLWSTSSSCMVHKGASASVEISTFARFARLRYFCLSSGAAAEKENEFLLAITVNLTCRVWKAALTWEGLMQPLGKRGGHEWGSFHHDDLPHPQEAAVRMLKAFCWMIQMRPQAMQSCLEWPWEPRGHSQSDPSGSRTHQSNTMRSSQ
jgi:hypothetical protein